MKDELLMYKQGKLTLLIPNWLKVKKNAPKFYAEAKGGAVTLTIEVNPDKEIQSNWEKLLHAPLGKNPMLKSDIIRRRNIKTPFPGWESVIEHNFAGNANFNWGFYFYPKSESFILFQLNAKGHFKEQEEYWSKVISSIQIS